MLLSSRAVQQQATATFPATASRRRPRWFYTSMGIVATLVVVAGFGGSYYGMATGAGSLPPLVKVHGLVFALWLILFIAQTTLVAARRVAVHRRLGYAAAALAPAMVGLGYATAIEGARRGFDLNFTNDPLGYMVFPLGSITAFTVLAAGGFWYRRRPEVHKRLMLLATVGPLMNAPLAHLFAHTEALRGRALLFLCVMLVLLFACAVYDRLTCGRFHPVSLWGAVALFAWGNLQAVVIGPSGGWHRFAAWLIS
jgi:hypothetical protein